MSPATRPTDADVDAFLDAVARPVRRRDARTLVDLLARVTGERPVLWGTSIVGFGAYRYAYASGHRGEAAAASFSPRAAASVVYLPDGVGAHADLLAPLGPHTTGVGCLYLTDLEQVDLAVLEELVRRSYATVTAGTFGQRAADGAP